MKNLFKRSLATALALVMCISMLNLTAFAADEPTESETPPATTETVPDHTHNAAGTKDGKEGRWVCTLTSEKVLDEKGNPICTLAPHTHSAACEGNDGFEIVCGLREHEHTDACYTKIEETVEKPVIGEDGAPVVDENGEPVMETVTETKSELTCPLEAHKHIDSCYVCDTPLHTHDSTSCQYQQVEKWVCNFVEKQSDEVKENDKLPVKTPNNSGNVSEGQGNKIYVYVEPDSIKNYDPNATGNDHAYLTLAQITITDDLLTAYNKANSGLTIESGTASNQLTPEQFNALVKFALKNGAGKDEGGNVVSVDGKNIDDVCWVYVKGSSGADVFVTDTSKHTVHADGHVHVLDSGDVGATCTQGGYTVYHCTQWIGKEYDNKGNYKQGTGEACTYTKTVYTPALGHNFVTDNADWHTDGPDTHSITCTRCGEKMTQAHSWVVKQDWSEWKATESDPNILERTRVLGCSANCGVADRTERQTKRNGQYLVTYVYEGPNGEDLGSGLIGKFYPGAEDTVTPPAKEGYTTPDAKDYSVVDEDIELVFKYEPIDYTLSVGHVYRYHRLNGTTETTTVDPVSDGKVYHINDAYSTSASGREGYTVTTPENASGIFGAGDITVTYYYDASEQEVPPPPPPAPTPTPTPSPEPSEEVEVTEPPTPLDPTPELPEEPVIDVEDPETPLDPLPELPEEPVEVEVEDPDVPLANVPQTGDNTVLWATTAVVSGAGLIWLAVDGKKRREDAE